MKRLLCIVSSMDRGGAETFLMKVYRKIDKTKFQMDFCVSKQTPGFYDEEIKSLGGKIFYIPPKSKNPFKNFLEIKRIVKRENYNSVLRTSQQSLATLDLLAAKFGGAKKLIYRSSNAGLTGGKISIFINKIFSFLPKIIPNVKIAPSVEAGEFVFGKNRDFYILHNALNYEDFKFNKNIRNKIRNELNVGNKTLYGHVGRFNIQKNHEFLIKVFLEINKKNPDSVLLMIGEGEEKEKIKKMVEDLNLTNQVIFLEPKPNINEYLMAMDTLIFPSFFEGMPNVVIEAQATGLKCFVSDSITKEANITALVKYISLNQTSKEWANTILKDKDFERKDTKKHFLKNKYMVEQITEEFIKKCY